jgi:nucleolar protein 58
VYNCDYCVEKHSESLREAGKHLKNISGINSEGWSLFKLATALKMVCYPEEDLLAGDPRLVNHSILQICYNLVCI